MKKHILITGADGFIGSHLTEYLLKKNYKITAMVYYNAFNNTGLLKKSKNKNLNIIFSDIRDYHLLEKQIKNTDIIINLAALIGIPYSYIAVKSYIDTNIIGTFNILELIKKYNINHTIFLSTSEVYGSAQYTPIDEKHPINPQSPYAATKVGADALINSYIKSFNLPITIIRPFNTFGPRQSLRAVIPTIITQIIKGNTVKIGSLNTYRDFNYINNTLIGIEKTICNKNTFGKTINIGYGKMYEISDIIDYLAKYTNKKLRVVSENKRKRPSKSEVKTLCANIDLAKSLLSYSPKITFYKGLERTYKWYEKNIDKYNNNEYVI